MLTPAFHQQAIEWLDARTDVLPGEEIAVPESAGRVLARDVAVEEDYPPTPTAAVDGFALPSAATVGASDYNPLPLRVRGASEEGVHPDEARPVVSGQPLPGGADAVVPLEETEPRGDVIDIYAPVAAGDNVTPAGREAGGGDVVLHAGRVLRAADTALLFALGLLTVSTVRRPRVGVIVVRTDVHDASGIMIASMVPRDGGAARDPVYARDDGLAGALDGADDDMLLVIGGSGTGPNDHAADALAKAGEVAFRGIAISPGETTTLGRVQEAPVIILPGPPLAALFAYDMIAGRAVRRLAGRAAGLPYGTQHARLDRKIASGLGRLECCRVRVADGRAEPIAVADNRTLSTAVRADGFVLVPEHSEGYAAGAEVTVYMYDQRF